MKHILVTGGAGFIGSHLVSHLVQQNYRVRVLDNLVSGSKDWVVPEAEFLQGDITDFDSCLRATEGVDGVFHMAAMSRSGPSIDATELCTNSNVTGTLNVLNAARKNGVPKLVYSGSSTFYGSLPIPHVETQPKGDFLNMYGLTKFAGEQYCLLFDRLYGIKANVLRYFNVYGPRQPQVGPYALVLGIFLQRWLKGEPLEVHGDGQQRRDFVHVSDVVRANVLAYETEATGEVFNIGSGTNVSIKELADAISKNQIWAPARQGDANQTLADISKARRILGWAPRKDFHSGLKEMMERMKLGLE